MRLNYIDNVDCLDGIKDIPDNSVDCIIADPPYALNMGRAGDKDNSRRAGCPHQWSLYDLSIAKPFYTQLFREFARVLKDMGSFYWFTNWQGYAFYFPIVDAALPVKNLIVWDKLNGPGNYYTFSHELIIFGTYASKLLHAGGNNVWRVKGFSSGAKSTNGSKLHPTQKPIELIEKAICDSTEPGGVILDPFMGSGTAAVASVRTGRNYIGFEIDEKYHAIALDRIAAESTNTMHP